MSLNRWILTVGAGALLAATPAAASSQDRVEVTRLHFTEQDPGAPSYQTRILISSRYLRSDEGADSGDYILFDRQEGTIYSVATFDESILVIPARDVDAESPLVLELDARRDADAEAPRVEGRQVVRYEIMANGERCWDLHAAEELLPGAVEALREFRTVLAGEHAHNMHRTPPEMQTPCRLANNIFAPLRHLDHGFPVQMRDHRGHSRMLVDYAREERVDADLFELPEDYRRYRTDEVTGGP